MRFDYLFPNAIEYDGVASDTATLYIGNVEMPAGNLIDVENEGLKAVLKNFNGERLQAA
jgi:alkylation response protein AidB-like acyl-CoA dehydrogenase